MRAGGGREQQIQGQGVRAPPPQAHNPCEHHHPELTPCEHHHPKLTTRASTTTPSSHRASTTTPSSQHVRAPPPQAAATQSCLRAHSRTEHGVAEHSHGGALHGTIAQQPLENDAIDGCAVDVAPEHGLHRVGVAPSGHCAREEREPEPSLGQNVAVSSGAQEESPFFDRRRQNAARTTAVAMAMRSADKRAHTPSLSVRCRR
jgi:hypothetical protein